MAVMKVSRMKYKHNQHKKATQTKPSYPSATCALTRQLMLTLSTNFEGVFLLFTKLHATTEGWGIGGQVC